MGNNGGQGSGQSGNQGNQAGGADQRNRTGATTGDSEAEGHGIRQGQGGPGQGGQGQAGQGAWDDTQQRTDIGTGTSAGTGPFVDPPPTATGVTANDRGPGPHPRRSGWAPWLSVPGCRTRHGRAALDVGAHGATPEPESLLHSPRFTTGCCGGRRFRSRQGGVGRRPSWRARSPRTSRGLSFCSTCARCSRRWSASTAFAWSASAPRNRS